MGTKISQLDAAGPLSGTETLPVVQGGVTKRATVAALVQTEAQTRSDAITALQNAFAVLDVDDVNGLVAFLAAKAPLASPTLTGTPTAPTPPPGTSTTQLSTTAFVAAALANLVNAAPGTLDTLGELASALGNDPNFATTLSGLVGQKLAKSANLNDLSSVAAARGNLGLGDAATKNVGTTPGTVAAGDLSAPLASPFLTGTPTAPTPVAGTNTTQLATTAFVAAALANLVNLAPGTLDTLGELASALGNDPNFAATLSALVGQKLAKSANLGDLSDAAAARGNLGIPNVVNAVQLRGVNVAPTAPTTGQGLVYDGTNWAPGTLASGGANGSGSAGGNTALTLDATALASPYTLSSSERSASTLIFTGTRSGALTVNPGAAGTWTVVNRTSQNLALARLDGAPKISLAPGKARVFALDATRAWTSALTALEGKPAYPATLDTSHALSNGLVLCFAFNEGSGTLAHNLATTGTAYNGTLVSSAIWSTDADGAPCLDFSATAGPCVNVPSFGTIAPTNEITIVWGMRHTTTAGGTALVHLNNSDGANRISLAPIWSDNTFYWDFGNLNSGGRLGFVPASSLMNAWHTLAVVSSASGNAMLAYSDGTQIGSKSGYSTLTQVNFPLCLGGYGSVAAQAKMTHLRIYNRALSAAEIAALNTDPYAGLA